METNPGTSTLSPKERDKAAILNGGFAGSISQVSAAEMLRLSGRQIRRLMRLDGITDIDAASVYLDKRYLPRWNVRFTHKPASEFNAHRSREGYDLEAIFSVKSNRRVYNDFTFKWNGSYQIEPGNFTNDLRGKSIIAEKRVNDEMKARFGDRYLSIRKLS
jgi:hypothetical protein